MLWVTGLQARKTYKIKDMIGTGELQVHAPKVMANDVMWCFLKDDNNDYCIEADLNWKVEYKTD